MQYHLQSLLDYFAPVSTLFYAAYVLFRMATGTRISICLGIIDKIIVQITTRNRNLKLLFYRCMDINQVT